MSDVIVMGHSFVKRLRSNLTSEKENLDLADAKVTWLGYGGARVGRIRGKMSEVPDKFNGVIFLQIGENDIHPKRGSTKVADDILALVEALKRRNPNSSIAVGSLFDRLKPRGMSRLTYRKEMSEVNDRLRKRLTSIQGVTFWEHRRNFRLRDNIYDRKDGVHLTEKATRRFYFSIRTCVRLLRSRV